MTIIKECWERLSAFHQAGFSHRDIKLSNYLVHENSKPELKIYLSDLGLAVNSKEPIQKKIATNHSLLPPFAKKNKQINSADPKLDNWAFGLMICNLLRMSNPLLAYDADKDMDELAKVLPWLQGRPSLAQAQREVSKFINDTFEKAPLTSNKQINDRLKLLVTQMMAQDPQSIPDDLEISARLEQIFQDLINAPN